MRFLFGLVFLISPRDWVAAEPQPVSSLEEERELNLGNPDDGLITPIDQDLPSMLSAEQEAEFFALVDAEGSEVEELEEEGTMDRNLRYVTYTKYYGKACRTASGGQGSHGKEYYMYSWSESKCKSKCNESSSCKAYEYSRNRCEIWYHSPKYVASKSGFTCYVKNTNHYPNNNVGYYKKDGYYCRTSGWSAGSHGDEYYYYSNWSKSKCQSKCSDFSWCKGFEYRSGNKCELWKVTPKKFKYNGGYLGCYVKK